MTETAHPYPRLVPTVAEYVAAFKKIEGIIHEKQREMLIKHHGCAGHVTTSLELSGLVGYADQAANIHYGQLGQMLGAALGLDEYHAIAWLVLFVPPAKHRNTQLLWIMRENVALALEELGWVPKTSDLFLPQGPEGYSAGALPAQ
jgi:hypothetical protein